MKTFKIDSKYGSFDCFVDDADYELISRYNWNIKKCLNTNYLISSSSAMRGKTMHRLIMATYEYTDGCQVDHIDGNGLNNQRSNLRICSASENQMNQRAQKRKSSLYKGVCEYAKGKWSMRIKKKDGGSYWLTLFSERDAAIAYDIYAKKLFGEFAKLNIPDASKADIDRIVAFIANPQKRQNTSSQYFGVYLRSESNRWGWNVTCGKRNKNKSGYATAIEAARARDAYIKLNNLSTKLSIDTTQTESDTLFVKLEDGA